MSIFVSIVIALFFVAGCIGCKMFPDVPCSKSGDCSCEYLKMLKSDNTKNSYVQKFHFERNGNVQRLILDIEEFSSEVTVAKYNGYSLWTMDSLIGYNSTDEDLKLMISEVFENVALVSILAKYGGIVGCMEEFGGRDWCNIWTIKKGDLSASFYSLNVSNSPLFQMEFLNKGGFQAYQFDWGGESKVSSIKMEEPSYWLNSNITPFPKFWSDAMEAVHIIGFDGGNSIKIDKSRYLYVFGDSSLERSTCSREVYGPGLSNSLLVVEKNETGYSAFYTPYDPNFNDCAEMFLLVKPEKWRDPYDYRYWPGGGLTVGEDIFVSYSIISMGTNQSEVGDYIAKGNSKTYEFDMSDRTKYPFFGHASSVDDQYYYFFSESSDSTYHYILLSRVEQENFLVAEEYEVFYGIDKEGNFMFGKMKDGFSKSDALPVTDLIGMNPQTTVRYNKYIDKFMMTTSSSDVLYVQLSDDLLHWTQQFPIFVNDYYKKDCQVYCPYQHPEMNSDDDSQFFVTLSFGGGKCPSHQDQVVKIEFQ